MSSRRVRADDVGGLTVADVMHDEFETVAPTATVGQLREWFAGSASRRLALIADGAHHVGSLTRAELDGDFAAALPVAQIARTDSTLSPEDDAATGRDLMLRTEGRRRAVVDRDGHLVGVLAMTIDGRFFSCRAG